jgi:hypothetical protein
MLPDHLFSKVDWFYVKANQERLLAHEVATMDGTRLLNTSVADLCKYLEEKYRIDVPDLREYDIVVDQEEIQIDESQNSLYRKRNPQGPFTVLGTAIVVTIPFNGDPEAFKYQPTTSKLNLPFGEVTGDELVFRIEGINLDPEKVRADIDQNLSKIRTLLNNLRKDAEGLNGHLPQLAGNVIEERRNKLLADHNLVAALGFALRERDGQVRTYVAPHVRRKIKPDLPPASTAPFKPELTLSNADYDHIIKVIENMARVMELSPSAFRTMNEESIRFVFLVSLNGHYEGYATAEAFNYEGKTDILIRVEGKNIFIAECKFWDGPKAFTEAIDQLLSYSSWRDTKVAIIIFNRNKNFSRVLDAIPSTVEAHPNFKRAIDRQSETNFQYIFAHRDDPNREMLLTVMAFDVPG